jgi:hypothetical protein
MKPLPLLGVVAVVAIIGFLWAYFSFPDQEQQFAACHIAALERVPNFDKQSATVRDDYISSCMEVAGYQVTELCQSLVYAMDSQPSCYEPRSRFGRWFQAIEIRTSRAN